MVELVERAAAERAALMEPLVDVERVIVALAEKAAELPGG